MKNYFFVEKAGFQAILLCLVWLASVPLSAQEQLSKEEEKALKSELKALKSNLSQYKRMKSDNEQLSTQITEKEQELARKRSIIQQSKKDIVKKDDAIESLQGQLIALRGDEVNAARQGRGAHDCSFSVQVGAYSNQDLNQELYQYVNTHENFRVEEGSGLIKYSLGFFTSYWEAKSFSKYLDSIGAQTYVIGYYKGERIPDLKDMTQCTF